MSSMAVAVGLRRATAILKEGKVLIAPDPAAVPEAWLPIAPLAEDEVSEIRSICMSTWALLALDSRGRVLSANFNMEQKELRWALVPALQGVEVVSLQSRFGQVYVTTRDWELYAWGLASGDGTEARACSVGLPSGAQDLPSPIKISGTPGVERFGFGRAPVGSVACGAVHAVFLSTQGEAFSVGQGREGQLGNRCLEDASVPVKMALPNGVQVRSAACGLRHTLLLSTTGEAWGCGDMNLGQLPIRRPSPGVLTPDLASEGLSTWTFEVVPRRLDLLPAAEDFFVVSVACGLHSSFFVGEDGSVLLTGTVLGDPMPFGRPSSKDPKAPYRLLHLPKIREVAVSLNVPLKLPGLPAVSLHMGMRAHPAEIALFRAADEPRVFTWGSPGVPVPRELNLEAAAPPAVDAPDSKLAEPLSLPAAAPPGGA